jgi:hypothetical protein
MRKRRIVTQNTNSARLRSRHGMASSLVIMVLVLLIFFAVLSAVASGADLRLSKKHTAWNQQYYLADSAAVSLFAGLDQYMRGESGQSFEPDNLADLLDAWLAARADVREYQITIEDRMLRARILVLDPADSQVKIGTAADSVRQQGIEMTLLITAGSLPDPSGRIRVASWTQWQVPFEYDTEDGGVWKG